MKNKIMLAGSGLGIVGLVTLLVTGIAGATTGYNPTSSLTSFADAFGTTAGPIVLAVGSAFVGLAILFWGLRFAFGFIGTRIRH